MKIAIIAISREALIIARRLEKQIGGAQLLASSGVKALFAKNWTGYDGFICVMAAGIVVRTIAPLLNDKRRDPCVVVVDAKGQYAISLLSGHLGGGNELAGRVADTLGGQAVITTASDSLELVALDIWARTQQLVASDEDMTRAAAILVNAGSLQVYSEVAVDSLPAGLVQCNEQEAADITISNRDVFPGCLQFCPKNLVLGTGCNRNTPAEEFSTAVDELFTDLGLLPAAISNLASIDKKRDEVGLLAFAAKNYWPIDFFSKEEINKVSGVEISAAPLKAVGAIGVAEPCAILSASISQNTTLISRKRKWQNITMAVAVRPFTLSAQEQDPSGSSPSPQVTH